MPLRQGKMKATADPFADHWRNSVSSPNEGPVEGGRPLLRGRVFGFPVHLDLSFVIIMALFGFRPGVTLVEMVLWLLITPIAVLVHELGHAFMAMSFGVRVRDVTLSVIGGVALFDYRKLNAALVEIAGRRFGNQMRKAETYQAVLMADPAVPYGTLISVISAMRCKMSDFGKELQTCYLPTADEKLKASPNPVDDVGRLYDTSRTPYDPGKHALFSDVVFSGGFR